MESGNSWPNWDKIRSAAAAGGGRKVDSVLRVGSWDGAVLWPKSDAASEKGWWICEEGIHWWICTKFKDWFPSCLGEWWADWPAGDPWEVEAPPTNSHKADRPSKLQQGWEVPPSSAPTKTISSIAAKPPEETNKLSRVPLFALLCWWNNIPPGLVTLPGLGLLVRFLDGSCANAKWGKILSMFFSALTFPIRPNPTLLHLSKKVL